MTWSGTSATTGPAAPPPSNSPSAIASRQERKPRPRRSRCATTSAPARLLELACKTGEVTRLVHDLDHKVAALRLARLLAAAGFVGVRVLSHRPIARAQRSVAGLRNRLRTRIYDRFVTLAENPGEQRRP